ncbi:MAG: hypothetical protein WC137_03040 [Alphaproteobacteria bacterium]
MALIDSFIQKYNKSPGFIGSSKVCFSDDSIDPNYVLLSGNFQMTEPALLNVIKKTEKLNNNGVNITQIYDYKIVNNFYWPNGYILEKKMNGSSISENRSFNEKHVDKLDYLSSKPLEFFHKWLFDYYEIIKMGLVIDTHSSNLLLSKDALSFIDVSDKSILETTTDDVNDGLKMYDKETTQDLFEMRVFSVLNFLQKKAKQQPDQIEVDIANMIFNCSYIRHDLYPELSTKIAIAHDWVAHVLNIQKQISW